MAETAKKITLLSAEDIVDMAEYYFQTFLPYFQRQPEGDLSNQVFIQSSSKMTTRIGLSYLFESSIRLNESYFRTHPNALPYTMFHEMTHLWLYQCHLDPGHTKRFYKKMSDFAETGYEVDRNVFVHSRVQAEAKLVYWCHHCGNRWFVRELSDRTIYCGHCYRIEKKEYFPDLYEVETATNKGLFFKVIRPCA